MEKVIENWVLSTLSEPQTNSICEKLDMKIDIPRLQGELDEICSEYNPVMQGQHFGGWSVLSADGTYRDGWQMGHKCYQTVNGVQVTDTQMLKKIKYKPALAWISRCKSYVPLARSSAVVIFERRMVSAPGTTLG